MLDINTRSESNLHGTWARIWASRGVRERYHCHHIRITQASPLRTKTAIVCGLSHAYSLVVAWLTINTSKTVATMRRTPPR